MKQRILKNWNAVRFMWLFIGIAAAITALIQHNYFLLLPACYFIIGSIANVGCFAQSCAVDFRNKKEAGETRTPIE